MHYFCFWILLKLNPFLNQCRCFLIFFRSRLKRHGIIYFLATQGSEKFLLYGQQRASTQDQASRESVQSEIGSAAVQIFIKYFTLVGNIADGKYCSQEILLYGNITVWNYCCLEILLIGDIADDIYYR